ncbi:secretion protein HlyD [Edwardsiella tarda]|uniref:secretion protein HlyD n=1 Tax=Edwardsiella tarda TaxID=636 RepID=UPI000BE2F33A|nr:secretion protein HlyD [Edwardsiella tarda]ATI65190.1 secretion protein HlyD [Edwardsiella tarda]
MNKRRVAGVVIGIVLIALIAGGYGYYRSQQDQPLALYGNVDIRTVNLGFRVSGRLASLTVDEGAAVKPGMLLGRLDDAPYVNALNEARAAAAAAQANLALLQAGYRSEEIAQAQAAVVQAEANYRYMQSFYERQQGLWASRAVSANELESARTNRNQAQAQLQQARDRLAQYQSGNRPQQIEQAQAQLQQAQAQVAQAELNLHDTALFAPSRGTVMTRAVEPGTMLAAGNTVFNVALTRPVWVRAYIDETHLDRAIPGTPIALYIDGRRQPYHGTIGFVSPTAEFTPKSVETPDLRTSLVYRLRVIVDDADDALRQGMPVTLRFPTPPAQR